MTAAVSILEEQLRAYDGFLSSGRTSDEAEAHFRLQESVAWCSHVYDRICSIDSELSEEMLKAGQKPDDVDARAMYDIYAKWAEKAEANLQSAAAMEEKGWPVRGTVRLKEQLREAQVVLSIPVDRLLKAEQNARSGRGRPMGDVKDELRRHLGT